MTAWNRLATITGCSTLLTVLSIVGYDRNPLPEVGRIPLVLILCLATLILVFLTVVTIE